MAGLAGWEGINHRIYRAGQRLHALDTQVRAFIDSGKPCTAGRDKDDKVLTFEIAPQDVPHEIVVLTGEIASELWAAVVEAVAASGVDGGDLPSTHTPEQFAAWMNTHFPQVWMEERAVSEFAQPHEGADWLSDVHRIAQDYARGDLKGCVVVDGNIRRSWPLPESGTDPAKHPPVAHSFAPGLPLEDPHFNMHMHVALAVQVVVGTPINVVGYLEEAHAEVRALVNALSGG